MVVLPKVVKMPAMNGIIRNDQQDMTMDEDKISILGNSGQSRVSNEGFPALTVSDDDILSAAKQAKRLTSGGLLKITPWHLRRAIDESVSTDCAVVAARVATRRGNGEFDEPLGELIAESKLVAL